eukprot:360538-Chlamydomonas_euryale.AAC.7
MMHECRALRRAICCAMCHAPTARRVSDAASAAAPRRALTNEGFGRGVCGGDAWAGIPPQTRRSPRASPVPAAAAVTATAAAAVAAAAAAPCLQGAEGGDAAWRSGRRHACAAAAAAPRLRRLTLLRGARHARSAAACRLRGRTVAMTCST